MKADTFFIVGKGVNMKKQYDEEKMGIFLGILRIIFAFVAMMLPYLIYRTIFGEPLIFVICAITALSISCVGFLSVVITIEAILTDIRPIKAAERPDIKTIDISGSTIILIITEYVGIS